MKKRKYDFFTIVCFIIMLIVLFFVGGIILIITVRGLFAIPEHLREKETVFALFLSIKTALISTIFCFLLAVPTAYVLTHVLIPLKGGIEILLELTMTLPYIVFGLSLLILFSSPLGKQLKACGFAVVFDQNGIIIAQLAVNLPFAIKLVVMAFREVNQKLESVAALLGASPFQRFYTILLPLCKNTLVSAFILIWSRALGEFGATLMLVGVTRMKTETLPGNIYLNVSTNHLEGALASAFLLLVLAAISLFISNRITRGNKKNHRYVQEERVR